MSGRNHASTAAHVIWFTGISGAGKSTLAERLKSYLDSRDVRAELLDGDVVRDFFEKDLGYTRPDRIMNVRRIAFAAEMVRRQGVLTLVANIAPYVEVRDFIRRKIPNYIQVYVKSELAVVQARDVKGHYKDFQNGDQKNLIGIDDAYEPPRNPDIVVETGTETIEESFEHLLKSLTLKGVLSK